LHSIYNYYFSNISVPRQFNLYRSPHNISIWCEECESSGTVEGGVKFENITINEIIMPSEFKQNITKSVINAWNYSLGITTFENKSYAVDEIKFVSAIPNVSVLTVGGMVKFDIMGNYITADNVIFTIDGLEFVNATPSPKMFYYEHNPEIRGDALKVIWDLNNSKINYTITLKANLTRYLKYSVLANETNGVLEYNDSIKVLPTYLKPPDNLYEIWTEMYEGGDLRVYVPNESVMADSDLILGLPVFIINNGTEDYDLMLIVNSSNDSITFVDTLLPRESFNYTAWLWFDNPKNCNEYKNITICLNASTNSFIYPTNCISLSNYVLVNKPPQPVNISASLLTDTENVLIGNISFVNAGCNNGTFEIYAFTNDSYLEVTPYEVNVSAQSSTLQPITINISNLNETKNITLVVESDEGFYGYVYIPYSPLKNYSSSVLYPGYEICNNPIYSADDGYVQVTLSQPFKFYDKEYSTIYIGTNGYITFDSGSWQYWNIPQMFMGTKMIAVDAGDLVSTIHICSTNNGIVIRWQGSHYGYNDNVDTQAVLYANGNIKINLNSIGVITSGWPGYAVTGVSRGDGKYYTSLTANNNVSYGLSLPYGNYSSVDSYPGYEICNNPIYSADDGYVQVTLSQPFKFYDKEYSTIYIGTNGYITFDSGSWQYWNIPQMFMGTKMIAVDAGDLVSTIHICSTNNGIVIRWQGSHYGYNDNVDTQAVLYANGNIKINLNSIGVITSGWPGYAVTGVSRGDGKYYTSLTANNNVSYVLFKPPNYSIK